LRRERAAAKQDEEVAKPVAAGGGWLGYLGWGSATAAVNVEADDDVLGLNEEQRKELYQAIEWNEREAVAAAVDLPKDFMQLRVKTKLETGSFALRVDPHGKNSDLISLNFDGFALDMIQRPDNFEAVLALGGLRVFDGTCEGSVHPQIVRVKEVIHGKEENDGEDQRITELRDEDREAEDDDGLTVASPPIVAPFFSLKFEHNPLDGRADNALAVRLRPMEIVYSRIYVEAIVKFFKPPESQLESVGALIDVASVTLEGIRKETRAGLEYALTQHKTVDLLLDLNAVSSSFIARYLPASFET
jgi:vacuolar protein sorting-associated protein 13A/C